MLNCACLNQLHCQNALKTSPPW